MAKKNAPLAKRNGSPLEPLDSDPNARPAEELDGEVEVCRRLTVESHSGPIPHPRILAEYDRIVPGSAREIIGMVTEQSVHRRDLERFVIVSDARRSNWGLACGFLVSLACVGGSVWLGMAGHDKLALALVAAPVLSYLPSFIYGTNSRRQERVHKTRIMTRQDKEEGEAEEG